MKKLLLAGVIAVMLLAGIGAVSAANLVSNGGFESPIINDTFVTMPPGVVSGWNIDSGTIDLIRTYWVPHSGSQSIDLAGLTPGTISQTLPTVNGGTYTLSFWMAGNQDNGGGIRSARVFWGGNEVAGSPFNFTATPKGQPMGWELKTVSGLTATGPTVLEFRDISANSLSWGTALDDISVEGNQTIPTPEFPTMALPAALIVGLLGAVLFVRKSEDN